MQLLICPPISCTGAAIIVTTIVITAVIVSTTTVSSTASAATRLTVISWSKLSAESPSATVLSWSAIRSSTSFKPFWNFLFCFYQQIQKITNNIWIFIIEEWSCKTDITDTSGTTNTMDIFINIGWQVEIDYMTNIWDIKTTSSNLKNFWSYRGPRWNNGDMISVTYGSGNENRCSSISECFQSIFSFSLISIAMNTSWSISTLVQVII